MQTSLPVIGVFFGQLWKDKWPSLKCVFETLFFKEAQQLGDSDWCSLSYFLGNVHSLCAPLSSTLSPNNFFNFMATLSFSNSDLNHFSCHFCFRHFQSWVLTIDCSVVPAPSPAHLVEFSDRIVNRVINQFYGAPKPPGSVRPDLTLQHCNILRGIKSAAAVATSPWLPPQNILNSAS